MAYQLPQVGAKASSKLHQLAQRNNELRLGARGDSGTPTHARQTSWCHRGTAHMLCENTPSAEWCNKGFTTMTKAAAYLLQLAVLVQKEQHCNHHINHIAKDGNCMADDASRLWKFMDD
jgi:hypothetical protein